jgi:hypothetical protein
LFPSISGSNLLLTGDVSVLRQSRKICGVIVDRVNPAVGSGMKHVIGLKLKLGKKIENV